MRNVLNRMKNQFSMNFYDNSKNKNRKTDFYLIQYIAHLVVLGPENESKTEGGGEVCISLLGTGPVVLNWLAGMNIVIDF